MTDILNPPGSRNFPYWPGIDIQDAQLIPGQGMAGEIVDIPLNKDRYSLASQLQKSDIGGIVRPQVLQDKTGAAQFLEGQPIMGRGAGIGLTDMLITSISAQQAQTKAAE